MAAKVDYGGLEKRLSTQSDSIRAKFFTWRVARINQAKMPNRGELAAWRSNSAHCIRGLNRFHLLPRPLAPGCRSSLLACQRPVVVFHCIVAEQRIPRRPGELPHWHEKCLFHLAGQFQASCPGWVAMLRFDSLRRVFGLFCLATLLAGAAGESPTVTPSPSVRAPVTVETLRKQRASLAQQIERLSASAKDKVGDAAAEEQSTSTLR